MKSCRDLDIYNESKRLAIEVHKISLGFPKLELYEEGSQLQRILLKDIEEVDTKLII